MDQIAHELPFLELPQAKRKKKDSNDFEKKSELKCWCAVQLQLS